MKDVAPPTSILYMPHESEGFSVQIARQLCRSTMLPAHAPWWQLSQETLYVFKLFSFLRFTACNLYVEKMKTFWYELKDGNRKHGAHSKSHTKSHKVAVPLFVFYKMKQQADFTCRNENCCPNYAYCLEFGNISKRYCLIFTQINPSVWLSWFQKSRKKLSII